MTIIQQPDAFSFSGNLKDLIIASETKVDLSLSQNGETFLSQSYFPDDDSRIVISLRDVIDGRLHFLLRETTDAYAQTSIAADFMADINGQPISFTVIRGGIDRPADTTYNFLKANFLSWQPQTKRVTYSSPEFLTYYAVVAAYVRLKAFFTDLNGNVVSNRVITLNELVSGRAYTIPLQYAAVAAKLDGLLPAFYDVWIDNVHSERLTYIQRFVADDLLSRQEQWILFENSLGGVDSFRAYGSATFTGEHSYNIANIDGVDVEYRIDTARKFNKNTGYLNGYDRRWLLDFFPSKGKFVCENGAFRRIVVSDSSVSFVDRELPSSYSFTFRYADALPFLNLPRSNAPPGSDLHIVIPDLGSFSLPPRLAELPRLALSEGALFPVISPFEDSWFAASLGEIFLYIADRLAGAGDPDVPNVPDSPGSALFDNRYLRKDADDTAIGAVAFAKSVFAHDFDSDHGWCILPSGDATLDAVRVRRDLTVAGVSRSEGFSDGDNPQGWRILPSGLASLDGARIRKDLIFAATAGSPSFASGFDGHGVRIDAADASASLDFLTVRKSLQVYELVYSQVYGLGGSVIVSDLNKIADVCLLADGFTFRCTIDSVEGMMRMNLRPGDIVRMQRSAGLNLRFFFGLVDAVSDSFFDLRIFEGDDVPLTGDVVFRFGSVSDLSRQGIIYLSSSDDHAPFIDVLDGVSSPSLLNKTKVRLGNLAGIRTRSGVNLSGYGLYAQGAVIENADIILDDGSTIQQWFSVFNGRLDSVIASSIDNISESEGNILRNSAFYKNLYFWSADCLVHFIDVNCDFLWIDAFYAEKVRVADLFRDGDRNVLRLKNAVIAQSNLDFVEHPLTPGRFSCAFFYKVRSPGTLSVGFQNSDLFRSVELVPSPDYKKFRFEDDWNGSGDFLIGFSGEILVYGLSLRSDALAGAVIFMQTQIAQTQEFILLLATKDYVDSETGDIYEHYDAQLSISAQAVSAVANRVSAIESASAGWITSADGNLIWANKTEFNALGATVAQHSSALSVQAASISAVANRVSAVESASAGWITVADGNSLWANRDEVDDMASLVATHSSSITQLANSVSSVVSEVDAITGQEIVSRINQTAEGVTISAASIALEGLVTANNNFKILPDGSMVAKGGRFNGYLSFPFKDLSLSDVVPLANNRFRINSDMNLIVRAGADDTIVLPDNPDFNGSLVNLFDSTLAWTYSMQPTVVVTEGNAQLRENVRPADILETNYSPPTEVIVAGGLHQFLCIYKQSLSDPTFNRVYWIHMSNIE
jgi:hypothetical protein